MMPLQRARVAESRVRNKSSNGPLRAQSKAIFLLSILRRWAGVTAGDMLVSRKEHGSDREARWHRG